MTEQDKLDHDAIVKALSPRLSLDELLRGIDVLKREHNVAYIYQVPPHLIGAIGRTTTS